MKSLDELAADHILSPKSRQAAPWGAPDECAMNRVEWPDLSDDALEKLLIERWFFRGLLIAAMLAGAVLTTYLGRDGLPTVADRLIVSVLIVVALSAAAIAWTMRGTDIRIHRELRRRRLDAEKG
jgi:hypothetical protein